MFHFLTHGTYDNPLTPLISFLLSTSRSSHLIIKFGSAAIKHEYIVALFDILDFEERLRDFGLSGMLSRYKKLIEVVNYRKK